MLAKGPSSKGPFRFRTSPLLQPLFLVLQFIGVMPYFQGKESMEKTLEEEEKGRLQSFRLSSFMDGNNKRRREGILFRNVDRRAPTCCVALPARENDSAAEQLRDICIRNVSCSVR